jgi:hypothetical protein
MKDQSMYLMSELSSFKTQAAEAVKEKEDLLIELSILKGRI